MRFWTRPAYRQVLWKSVTKVLILATIDFFFNKSNLVHIFAVFPNFPNCGCNVRCEWRNDDHAAGKIWQSLSHFRKMPFLFTNWMGVLDWIMNIPDVPKCLQVFTHYWTFIKIGEILEIKFFLISTVEIWTLWINYLV